MSLAPDFLTRWNAYAAATRAANGPPPGARAGGAAGGGGRAGGGAGAGAGGGGRAGGAAPAAPAGPYFMQDVDFMSDELATTKREGIGCIVDGGHPDMGRDVNFLRQILDAKSGLPARRRRGFLHAALLPERNLDDERGANRAGARQAGRR